MSFPTLSSSTPMSDWFASVTLLFNTVQQQTATIRTLQDRIVVLETRTNIPVTTTVPGVEKPKAKKVKTKDTSAKVADTEKKRGRKPAEVNLAAFLREGEQIIARIPLGDRRFDEHAVAFQEGHLVLEDGQTFDHPTTMCSALAKMLEDIGERSTDCSKSMNGWILCTVGRDGKRVPLEKLKPAAEVAEVAEAVE